MCTYGNHGTVQAIHEAGGRIMAYKSKKMLFLGLPGVRVQNVVARFSKYYFWILWNFLDRYCEKYVRKSNFGVSGWWERVADIDISSKTEFYL